MKDQTARNRLFREAYNLLKRVEFLLESARAKHEQKVAQMELKKAA